ncbi:MAG TPA: histidine kinase [Candidatus Egerieisoma faecipullorum]|uniref:histidine kinase n=1 Tax=Candidatus Egerieisoma faecipullorum TaxID=2840963 RepID=A0A9D1I769_9CLOT|nr:histidine kinase [Candidatus Egerieisoma faecipullorum]
MNRKIFIGIFAVALTVWLACIVCILGALYYYFNKKSAEEFRNEAIFVAQGIETSGAQYLEELSASPRRHSEDVRITWIAGDGTVLYDNYTDAAKLESHADREEFREALESGSGQSVRYSSTQMEKIIYYAIKLNDGSVLRVSDTQYTVLSVVVVMLSPILLILIVSLILAAVFAGRISKSIIRPINAIDLEHPENAETYDELAPLLEKIDAQNKQIARQMEELRSRRREFESITENMAEGLVIVGHMAEVLTCNPSALKILNADKVPHKQSVLTLNRSEVFRHSVDSALAGKPSEVDLEIGGKVYRLIASPVRAADTEDVIGATLIILDITEKNERERLRREFTANVSHELKTPLTSISGNAEIIKNGIVKPEDVPHFAENIYKEAGRLISLVNDIIKLSKLDEDGGEITKEPVDLSEIVSEVADSLRAQAERRAISSEIHTEKAVIMGIRPILTEMIYNLWENAIKYNKEGGKLYVDIANECQDGRNFVKFSIRDTGIGIPSADLERIFERFYRVDKSHSKEIGGTGLGLSIVKHGARLHGAEITVKSEIDKGSVFIIQFPKEA